MRIDVSGHYSPDDPVVQLAQSLRCFVDGVEVTNRCYAADDCEGIAECFAVDDSGQYILTQDKQDVVRERLYGTVQFVPKGMESDASGRGLRAEAKRCAG
jgi:hypothetical protein